MEPSNGMWRIGVKVITDNDGHETVGVFCRKDSGHQYFGATLCIDLSYPGLIPQRADVEAHMQPTPIIPIPLPELFAHLEAIKAQMNTNEIFRAVINRRLHLAKKNLMDCERYASRIPQLLKDIEDYERIIGEFPMAEVVTDE